MSLNLPTFEQKEQQVKPNYQMYSRIAVVLLGSHIKENKVFELLKQKTKKKNAYIIIDNHELN